MQTNTEKHPSIRPYMSSGSMVVGPALPPPALPLPDPACRSRAICKPPRISSRSRSWAAVAVRVMGKGGRGETLVKSRGECTLAFAKKNWSLHHNPRTHALDGVIAQRAHVPVLLGDCLDAALRMYAYRIDR